MSRTIRSISAAAFFFASFLFIFPVIAQETPPPEIAAPEATPAVAPEAPPAAAPEAIPTAAVPEKAPEPAPAPAAAPAAAGPKEKALELDTRTAIRWNEVAGPGRATGDDLVDAKGLSV